MVNFWVGHPRAGGVTQAIGGFNVHIIQRVYCRERQNRGWNIDGRICAIVKCDATGKKYCSESKYRVDRPLLSGQILNVWLRNAAEIRICYFAPRGPARKMRQMLQLLLALAVPQSKS